MDPETKAKIKTPSELNISDEEWVGLAESLLISRELVRHLGQNSELWQFHKMRVDHLERYFGITSGENADLTE